MIILKSVIGILLLITSLSVLAHQDRKHIQVNFYTLAASQSQLDGKLIGIRGWIAFYSDGDKQQVLLYPSEQSKKISNLTDSIEIYIDKKSFDNARNYLSGNLVTVYGIYNVESSKYSNLFGKITNIKDIDIVRTNINN